MGSKGNPWPCFDSIPPGEGFVLTAAPQPCPLQPLTCTLSVSPSWIPHPHRPGVAQGGRAGSRGEEMQDRGAGGLGRPGRGAGGRGWGLLGLPSSPSSAPSHWVSLNRTLPHPELSLQVRVRGCWAVLATASCGCCVHSGTSKGCGWRGVRSRDLGGPGGRRVQGSLAPAGREGSLNSPSCGQGRGGGLSHVRLSSRKGGTLDNMELRAAREVVSSLSPEE